MKRTITIAGAVATALIAACASSPERLDQLENARARVTALAQDPMVSEAAGRDLEAARTALDQADRALKEGEDRSEVSHLAYVADRHAEIGLNHIAEARARQQVAKAEADRKQVLLEARTREAEKATLEARSAQAAAQLQSQEAERARQEALSAQAELEKTQRDLADLQARQTERGMVLTLGDVLFDTGQATLKPGANATLDRLATFLKENPETRIIVEGHTDSQGSEDYNQLLSQRRAQAVGDALSFRGIEGGRFQIVGRGEMYPVASNESSGGRQQNRRVEIVFSDRAGQFAQGADRPASTLR